MRRPPLLLLAVLAVALLVAGCGADATPNAPTAGVVGQKRSQGTNKRDPVPNLLDCLKKTKIPANRVSEARVDVGPPELGIHVDFAPTGGEAFAAELHGHAEGAELVGRALFFVGRGDDALITRIESCVNVAGLKGA